MINSDVISSPTTRVSTKENPALSALWNQRYAELVEFKDKHNHCQVPREYAENKRLGVWVNNQRKVKNTMPEDRKDKLNAIGFDWSPTESSWNKKFKELTQYQAKHGHCCVPQGDVENGQLAAWVGTQRKSRSKMSKEKTDKLNAINFVWKQHEDNWNEKFQELVEFKSFNENCAVPCIYPQNPQLGFWVNNQRAAKDTMSKERKKKLDDLGFIWSVR